YLLRGPSIHKQAVYPPAVFMAAVKMHLQKVIFNGKKGDVASAITLKTRFLMLGYLNPDALGVSSASDSSGSTGATMCEDLKAP
ncbi:hypothetical protein C6P46_000360, partial [Rhodotorula mucilaginosa]